jgi:site-specific DNA-adenine methylase
LNNISANFLVREEASLEDDNDKVNTMDIKIRNRIDEIIDELNKLTFENNSVKIYNDPSKKPISVDLKKHKNF